jgi:hypothetical protein
MNDSAFGELVASGAHEGEDFGAIPFPGTADSFLAVVDVFVAATKATDAKNALAFLSGIENPATQLAFSRAKGSIPVVRRQRLLASGLPAAILQPNKDGESHPRAAIVRENLRARVGGEADLEAPCSPMV